MTERIVGGSRRCISTDGRAAAVRSRKKAPRWPI